MARQNGRNAALTWCRCVALLVALTACREAADGSSDLPVIMIPREPEELDPRFSGDPYGVKLSRLVHASLMTIDPRSLELVPDLAERLDIEDPLHYHVTLREGLRFADGSVLDADDVVATFRALTDPRVKSRFASTFSRIAEVRAQSPRQVVFTLREPHATFASDLEIPVLRAEDAFSERGTKLVGAGPYMISSRQNAELIMRQNPFYFRQNLRHPAVRFIVIRDDNTRALRLLGGAGDLAMNALPGLLLPLFEHRAGFTLRSAPGVGTTYVGLNLSHPKLADVRVRRALGHAIDRDAIIRYKLFGRARLATSWIVPGHWAHDEACPKVRYEPDTAQRLLDEAGLSPNADGVRLSLIIRTSSERSSVSTARALSAMWREIGVDVEVRPTESATLIADLNRGRFDLTFLQVPEVFEPHVLGWFFTSDHIPEPSVREGANRWRFRNAEFDKLIEFGRRTPDRAERRAVYVRAQRLLARELPVIPLWHDDVTAVTSTRFSDFDVPRDGRFSTLVR